MTSELNFTTFHNVIDGKLEDTTKKRTTINPSNLETNPEVPVSTQADVDKAIHVAQKAAKQWADVPWSQRKKALEDFTAAFESLSEEFAKTLVWEHGKPLLWARNEVATALKFLKGYATLSPLQEETIEDSAERKITTSYVPVGIAVGIVPWNYPIYLASAKIGPALLTGNAFILKASPFTPYTSLKMAELAQKFFPPGVFQALSGDDSLGPMLTSHPDVNMVSFTGSIPTGKAIMKSCSGTLKRVVLELGGNDPAIVCADADPVSAAVRIGLFAFCNSGQICMSIKRIYVHESIYDQFLGALVQHAGALGVGTGETDFLGPIATEPHFKRVQSLLSGIKDAGYTVVAGGTERLADKKGFYIPATIIDNPPEDSAIVKEEQFAPVIPVMKWSEENDVIQRANGTDAGLGASVWTRDDEQATRIAGQLQAGNVWINTHAEIEPNTPFSGHKQSGLGVEHSVEGLKAYCNVRSVFRKPF